MVCYVQNVDIYQMCYLNLLKISRRNKQLNECFLTRHFKITIYYQWIPDILTQNLAYNNYAFYKIIRVYRTSLRMCGPNAVLWKAGSVLYELEQPRVDNFSAWPLKRGAQWPAVCSIGLMLIHVNSEVQTQYLSSSASLRVMMEGYLILTIFRELYYFILMKFTVALSNI